MDDQRYWKSRLEMKAEHRPFDFDSYMSQIQQHTFKSVIVPIDVACAKAMVSYYQQRYNSRAETMSQNDIDELHKLRTQIAASIEREFDGGPIFCRMTNRSPKDGEPSNIDELSRIYKHNLSQLAEQKVQKQNEVGESPVWDQANIQLVAAFSAQLQMLRCKDAYEVMDLLLSSERVFMDTMLALDCASADSKNDIWSTCLILREWNEMVRGGDWEFRLFVHGGRLRAISQYNHYCIFPSLYEVDEIHLKKEIVEYWKIVRDSITFTNSHIIDIVKLSDGEWKVIELNPYAPTTGAALFDWNIDEAILYGKININKEQEQQEPELRIRRVPYEGHADLFDVVMLPLLSGKKTLQSGPWHHFLPISSPEPVDDSADQNVQPFCPSKPKCTIQ